MTTLQKALIEQVLRQHLPDLPAERLPALVRTNSCLRDAAATLAATLPMGADPSVFATLLARPLPSPKDHQ